MPKLAVSLVSACILVFSVVGRPHASLASSKPPPAIPVLIQLQGEPLAADTALRARTPATLGRLRFDPMLTPARLYGGALQKYQQTEIAYIRSHGVDLRVEHTFHILVNAIAATVPANQLQTLRSLANVKAALPERQYHPLLDTSLPLVRAQEGWSELGGSAQAGRRLTIADIDTGIDITNPCFNDTGYAAPSFGRRADTQDNYKFTNNKVIVARAYGQDLNKHYSAGDQVGHGTFTAGIEACDYNTLTPLGSRVSGVAPGAYLFNYNVFPEGAAGTGDAQIIAALEAALLDGADVANLSLGGTAGDPQFDFEVEAVNAAIKGGLTVVIAAGNEGTTPLSVSSPGITPDAITVGAITNSRGLYTSVRVVGSGTIPEAITFMQAREGSHEFKTQVGPTQMVYVGLGRKPGDDSSNPNADDFAGKDLKGKIALIQRGTLFFETKINNAAAAGAVGAIVFDNRDEDNLFGMDIKTATLPSMSISQSDGNAVLAYLKDHPDATAVLDPKIAAHDEVPRVLADLSSRGYGYNWTIKPDLMAPGVDVYSSTQSQYPAAEIYSSDGFVSENGTSASAPYVAGAAALVLEKHPKWTPAAVKAALVETASRDVYENVRKTGTPSVMQVGAGLLDVGSAVGAPAYLVPSSVSFGGQNVGYGPLSLDSKLTLSDAGGGAGAWQAAIDPLHTAPGLSISVPGSVQLSSGGTAQITVHAAATTSTPSGDYDGYVVLTQGSQTLHVPYFIHVSSLAVKSGSVLLIDNTTSLFQGDPTKPPIAHLDVTHYYTDALAKLGKSYTYWNEGTQGSPNLADLKKASAVIYYTGANLNAVAAQNNDPSAQIPPVSPTDEMVMREYMDAGGHLFITGMGAALTALASDWPALVLGAVPESLSLYDNANNDTDKKGGLSPPQPTARADTGLGALKNAGLFAGLKAIDFSTKGDGAGDNVAVNNEVLGLIGVPGMSALNGNYDPEGKAYGQSALKTVPFAAAEGGVDVGVVSSDEPTFKHKAAYYPGRSVTFSFGFEGINSNTGYATREEVLTRVFQWFDDQPKAVVTATNFKAGTKVQLGAALTNTSQKAIQYTWQVGNTSLKASGKATAYRFPHAGTYRVRVLITDALGHSALSAWSTVRVR